MSESNSHIHHTIASMFQTVFGEEHNNIERILLVLHDLANKNTIEFGKLSEKIDNVSKKVDQTFGIKPVVIKKPSGKGNSKNSKVNQAQVTFNNLFMQEKENQFTKLDLAHVAALIDENEDHLPEKDNDKYRQAVADLVWANLVMSNNELLEEVQSYTDKFNIETDNTLEVEPKLKKEKKPKKEDENKEKDEKEDEKKKKEDEKKKKEAEEAEKKKKEAEEAEKKNSNSDDENSNSDEESSSSDDEESEPEPEPKKEPESKKSKSKPKNKE